MILSHWPKEPSGTLRQNNRRPSVLPKSNSPQISPKERPICFMLGVLQGGSPSVQSGYFRVKPTAAATSWEAGRESGEPAPKLIYLPCLLSNQRPAADHNTRQSNTKQDAKCSISTDLFIAHLLMDASFFFFSLLYDLLADAKLIIAKNKCGSKPQEQKKATVSGRETPSPNEDRVIKRRMVQQGTNHHPAFSLGNRNLGLPAQIQEMRYPSKPIVAKGNSC